MLHSFLIDIIAWVQYGSRSRVKTGQLFEVQALGQLVELSVDPPRNTLSFKPFDPLISERVKAWTPLGNVCCVCVRERVSYPLGKINLLIQVVENPFVLFFDSCSFSIYPCNFRILHAFAKNYN